MRHVDSYPGSEYVFLGSQRIQTGNLPPAALAVLLKTSAIKEISDAWENVLNSVTDETAISRLRVLGPKADIVYTFELGGDGNAALSFYAGPPR